MTNAFPNTANYSVLTGNCSGGQGIDAGARINGNNEDQNVVTNSNLVGGQLVTVVYSGFTGVGSTGAETIYINGS